MWAKESLEDGAGDQPGCSPPSLVTMVKPKQYSTQTLGLA